MSDLVIPGAESVRYNLLQSFKTDCIWFDMLLGTILAALVSRIFSYQDQIITQIKSKCQRLWNMIYPHKKYQLSLNCLENRSPYGGKLYMSGSFSFKAMLFFLKHYLKKDQLERLYHIREFCCYDDDYDTMNGGENEERSGENINREIDTVYISDQTEPFQISHPEYHDVVFQMEREPIERNEKERGYNSNSQMMYTLNISFDYRCSVLKTNDRGEQDQRGKSQRGLHRLQQLVDDAKQFYRQEMTRILHKKQFVFVYEGKRQDQPDFTVYPFQTTTRMDTLFFDQKKEVLNQIDFFVNNKSWYESRGKPYTLGISSYGIPGCGKTTFEKALASYLGRHMIIVDFSKITTSAEADRIFFSETINDLYIPYNKRLYVFPDIDRMCDVINKSSSQTETSGQNKLEIEGSRVLQAIHGAIVSNSNSQVSGSSDHSTTENQSWKKHNSVVDGSQGNHNDKFSLSRLLNILDGVPERTGQVIMMSANHPEKIDPALLRPGRIDLLLHFRESSWNDTIEMVSQQYDVTRNVILDYLSQEQTAILDRKWTPAEIFQICSRYYNISDSVVKQASTRQDKKNFQQALDALVHSNPDSLRNPFSVSQSS